MCASTLTAELTGGMPRSGTGNPWKPKNGGGQGPLTLARLQDLSRARTRSGAGCRTLLLTIRDEGALTGCRRHGHARRRVAARRSGRRSRPFQPTGCHRRVPANTSDQRRCPSRLLRRRGGGRAPAPTRSSCVGVGCPGNDDCTHFRLGYDSPPGGSYRAGPLIMVVYGHLEPARGRENNQTAVHGGRSSAGCRCSPSPSVGSPDRGKN